VATWTLDALATSFHGAPVTGVELVVPDATVRDTMARVFDAWRVRQASELRRRPFRWDDELGLVESPWGETWKGLLALHRDAAGVVDGYVRYQAEEHQEHRQPRGRITVNDCTR